MAETKRKWWAPATWFSSAPAPRAEITTSKQLEAVLLAHGNISASGVSVTPETAMMVSGVSAATSLISETIAQLPLVVYRRLPGGGKERVPDHPVARLLRGKPNSWQNTFEFREFLSMHLTLNGNAYAAKSRVRTGQRRGEVVELIPLHSDRVMPEQDKDFVVRYKVMAPDGRQIVVPADEMFHIRDRNLNGFVGTSRLKTAQDTIGLARAAERWGAQLFGNGARPSGILSTDGRLAPEQMAMLKESWQAAHGGENALGTAVLDGGLKWQAVAFSSKDAQFIEMRKFQILEIARVYRIPPHMLGDLERATFSNIEHQSIEFVTKSLMPWLRRWEAAINTQLLDPMGDVFAEFVAEGLLRGDVESRYNAYGSALQNEWMSVNEVRERENLNPIPGGDVYRNPAINPQNGDGNEPPRAA